MKIDYEKEEQASLLRGSLLEFTRYFFEYITGRQFIISIPIGRESHHITVCRALTDLSRLKSLRQIINIPPGYGKSVLASMWAAWSWASFPDSNFLYISYSQELSAKHTAFIRSVVSSRMYQYLFDVELEKDSRAKDFFKTTAGGSIRAFGSGGSITGQDAGLPGLERFSGAVILDDAHKPDEVHSDTMRERVLSNYDETVRQRCRGMNVPILYIGQRVHEADLTEYFLSGRDVDVWDSLILKGLDDAGNALYPEFMSKEKLLMLQEKTPYVFAAQIQQNPLPAGGGLFSPEWFKILDEEPEFFGTFITADTAETDKSWNDATAFSFWGVYEIEIMGRKAGKLGLHWLDCMEIRVEPKDLQETFIDFYANCCLHKNPPKLCAIEKKSTGVTLVSVLKDLRGIQIREIERNRTSGSKTQRFIDMQSFISSKQVSFSYDAKHKNDCIKHMSKITANNTHRHDDIADTLSDAIRIAFIEKTLYSNESRQVEQDQILKNLNQSLERKIKARTAAYGGYR